MKKTKKERKPLDPNASLLRVSQVMEMLGVSHQQVNVYRKAGVLRSVQYMKGGDHRYVRADVLKLLEVK